MSANANDKQRRPSCIKKAANSLAGLAKLVNDHPQDVHDRLPASIESIQGYPRFLVLLGGDMGGGRNACKQIAECTKYEF